MKKLLCCLCVLCITILSLGINASALETIQKNTHFDSPSGVCADADNIFVADNSDGKGILHIFSSDDCVSVSFDRQIFKIRQNGSRLFLLSQDCIYVYDTQDKTAQSIAAVGVADLDATDTHLYTLLSDGVHKFDLQKDFSDFDSQNGRIIRGDDITAIAAGGQGIYYIADGSLCLNTADGETDLPLDGATCISFGAERLFKYGGSTVNGKDIGFNIGGVYALSSDQVLIVNNDDLTVRSFAYDGQSFTANPLVLGSNFKNYPTDFESITSFDRLQVCVANKRTFSYATEQDGEFCYLEKDSVVIKLSETDGFAYVLFINSDGQSQFGFVKSADLTQKTSTLLNLDKVSITSNESIYALPINDAKYKLQKDGAPITIKNTQPITVLSAAEGFDSDRWVLVQTDGTVGFMMRDRLKNPPVVYPSYEVYVANPKIGNSLSVYETADDKSAVIAKIKSGELVKVFETYGDFSKIQITVDGEETYGWVESQRLIKEGGLTDAASLGLAIGIAVLLAAGFAVFWRVRKKKQNQQ